MMLMSGIGLSTQELQKQVAKAIDLIVHIELFMDGLRRVTYVTNLEYLDPSGKVVLHDIFAFKQKGVSAKGEVLGDWVVNKKRPVFMHKLEKRRVPLPDGFFESK